MLTGNYYFKPTLFGLVLFVEKSFTFNKGLADEEIHKEFVKASVEDVFALKLVSNPQKVEPDVKSDIAVRKDMS